MLIDWFTVGAQILNFVILAWLLKRFLYKPILDAIEARENRTATELRDADTQRLAAKQERETLKRRSEKFERERADLMSTAAVDAATEREHLIDAAHAEAAGWLSKQREAQQLDVEALAGVISQRVQQEVLAIARKALTDLAGADLEQQVCEVFLQRLKALKEPARTLLRDSLRGAGEAPVVRSVFELPAARQDAIVEALRELAGSAVAPRFETAPEAVCGIELIAAATKVSWSVQEYLSSLQEGIAGLLAPQRPPGSPVAAVAAIAPGAVRQ